MEPSDYIYLIIITISLLVVAYYVIKIHSSISAHMRKNRKSWVVIFMFLILILDIILFSTTYINSTYPSETDTSYQLKSIILVNGLNQTLDMRFNVYFYSDGPLSANNPIYIEKIYFGTFISDYTNENYIHEINNNTQIDLSNCRFELRFSMETLDSPASQDEFYTLIIENANLLNKSYYYVPDNDDIEGEIKIANVGNARINCYGTLITADGSKYWFFEYNVNDDIMFKLEPTSEYLNYKNTKLTTSLIIIAAITFSVPSAIKTFSELYWGKEEKEKQNLANVEIQNNQKGKTNDKQ